MIQPIIEKQPILKQQTIQQPILQPSLTETYQSTAPEMIQTQQTNSPIVNQPTKTTLPTIVQQLPTLTNQPITQPLQRTALQNQK